MDGLLRRFAARNDENLTLDHQLPQHPPAIHLVFEVDHGGTGEMPGQTRSRGAAADQFIGEHRMEIMDGVGLHLRCVLPAKAKLAITTKIANKRYSAFKKANAPS